MKVTREKKDALRQCYIDGVRDEAYLARKFNLQVATVRVYMGHFERIEREVPDKLADFDFFIDTEGVIKESVWYENLMRILPELMAAEKGPVVVCRRLYRHYQQLLPGEYSEPRFIYHFRRWFDKHEAALCARRLAEKFTEEELATLRKWRKGNDRRLWQVAVTLMTVYSYQTQESVAEKIEASSDSMIKWRRLYEEKGLEAVGRPGTSKPISAGRKAMIEKRVDELIHLVRQPPRTYGVDRNSWTLTDLAYTYGELSGVSLSISTISHYLKERGVKYRRSREVIVSTDPLYQEKYEHIQQILGSLGPNEKFFSIDEYGPKAVRPKGGHMHIAKGERAVYRKVDRSKGWFICTCALELSTNQLSWFYSRKKDTDEMIKLIDVLVLVYQEQERLYLSWDAAVWHSSQVLKDYLVEINEPDYRAKLKTPEVVIVPLPTKAPHLNVIESVFSGMAKSVIHHSDYDSVEDCMAAIDRYFNKRNAHFRKNPKRAGQKIWGKEKVKPVFDKANICRNIG